MNTSNNMNILICTKATEIPRARGMLKDILQLPTGYKYQGISCDETKTIEYRFNLTTFLGLFVADERASNLQYVSFFPIPQEGTHLSCPVY